MKFSPSLSRKIISLAAVLALIVPKLFAADYVWSTTGNGSWGTASNWLVSGTVPAAAPTAADNITGFPDTGSGALQVNGDRSISNLIFSNTSRNFNIVGATTSTTQLLTVGGTLSVNSLAQTLTFRLSGSALLSLNIANIKLDSGTVQFGASSSQPIQAFTSTGSTLINGGTMNFVLASGTASLGAVTMQGGVMNVYNQTLGTGAVSVASLSGTAGVIQANSTSGTTVGNFAINGSSGTTTYGGTLSNGGSSNTLNVTKSGASTQILTGASTYTGTTTLSGGVLQLGNGGTTGSLSSSSTIINNATLAFNRSDAPVVSNAISGSGGVSQIGTGTTILTGANTYTGTTTISSGALQIGNAGSVGSIASDVSLQNDGALIFARTGLVTYGGAVSGTSGSILKQNSGTLSLTGASTFSGTTTVTAGNITLDNGNALQNSTVSVGTTNGLRFGTGTNSYTVGALAGSGNFALQDTASSAVTLRAGNNNASSSYSGDLTGAGSLVKVGTGTLTLTGSNSFSGAVTVTDGGLQIGQGGVAGTLTSDVNIQNNASLTFAKTGNTTYGGVISGTSGLLQKLNSGTLILTNASTFSGTTLIQNTAGNNIRLANTNALQNSTVSVSVTNGLQFDTGTNSYTIGALSGGSNFALQDTGSSAVILRTGNNNTNSTYSGVMSGTGALVKIGTGTLTLSGSNTYTGDTTVSAGTVLLNGAGQLGTGNVKVNGNLSISGITGSVYTLTASQTLSGTGTILASGKTLEIAGTLAPGNSPGTLTVNGGLTLDSSSASNFEITGTGAGLFDHLTVNGTLTFDGTLNLTTSYSAALGETVDLFDWTALSGTFASITGTSLGGGLSWDTSNLYTNGTITVVPEPSTVSAFVIGAAFLLFRRRSKRN